MVAQNYKILLTGVFSNELVVDNIFSRLAVSDLLFTKQAFYNFMDGASLDVLKSKFRRGVRELMPWLGSFQKWDEEIVIPYYDSNRTRELDGHEGMPIDCYSPTNYIKSPLLFSFYIENCYWDSRTGYIPSGLKHITNLKSLTVEYKSWEWERYESFICNMYNLLDGQDDDDGEVSVGSDEIQVPSIPSSLPSDFLYLQSLRELHITRFHFEFPDDNMHVKNLHKIVIRSNHCIRYIPEWIGRDNKDLECICLFDCPHLEYIHVSIMKRLDSCVMRNFVVDKYRIMVDRLGLDWTHFYTACLSVEDKKRLLRADNVHYYHRRLFFAKYCNKLMHCLNYIIRVQTPQLTFIRSFLID